jgi:hypothetical protein
MSTETVEIESDEARRTGSKFVAEAVLVVLKERGIDIPDDIRAEIEGCADLDQQFRWLRRAARYFPVQGFWVQRDAEKWAVTGAKAGTNPETIAKGLACRLVRLIRDRGGDLLIGQCVRLHECRDPELLLDWIGWAVVADTISQAIDFSKLPRTEIQYNTIESACCVRLRPALAAMIRRRYP